MLLSAYIPCSQHRDDLLLHTNKYRLDSIYQRPFFPHNDGDRSVLHTIAYRLDSTQATAIVSTQPTTTKEIGQTYSSNTYAPAKPNNNKTAPALAPGIGAAAAAAAGNANPL